MHPSTRLKLASLFLAVVWTVGMIWFSGLLNAVNVLITAFAGGVAGYAWYRLMRWHLPRGRVPSRSGSTR
jgi:hypothetical protein